MQNSIHDIKAIRSLPYCCLVLIFSLFFAYSPLTYAKNNNATAKSSSSVANSKKQKNLSSEQQFYSMVISFYNSDDPLMRILAYVNTKNIPFAPPLDKALRRRLAKTQRNTEKYIILNTLASTTHKRSDFDVFVKFIFAHPYVIFLGSIAEQPIALGGGGGGPTTTEIYPWMAHHNIYKRQAFLFGIIAAQCEITSEEAVIGYLAQFPTYAKFPEYPYQWRGSAQGDLAKEIFMSYGLSSREVTWLEKAEDIPLEEKTYWETLDDNNTTLKGSSASSMASQWGIVFDTFLPLLDMDGKGAELAKKFVSSQFKHHWNEDIYTQFH